MSEWTEADWNGAGLCLFFAVWAALPIAICIGDWLHKRRERKIQEDTRRILAAERKWTL